MTIDELIEVMTVLEESTSQTPPPEPWELRAAPQIGDWVVMISHAYLAVLFGAVTGHPAIEDRKDAVTSDLVAIDEKPAGRRPGTDFSASGSRLATHRKSRRSTMVIRDADRDLARLMYEVAIGIVAVREPEPIAGFARDALDDPSPSTVGALLVVGEGEPWLPSVVCALAHVGVAAIKGVLGTRND